VNAILRYFGSDWRIAMLGPPDQVVEIGSAPEAALRAWRAAGLLTFPGYHDD
jgi:hypothetical protein